MKLKVTIIGAGSEEFGPTMVSDLLLSDPINQHDLEISLMDISENRLPTIQSYAQSIATKLNRKVTVNSTTHLETSLEGADFVISAIEIKRYFYWSQDFHIPRKFGFAQIYGENGGPGGLFHALRNMVPTVEIARTMEKVCPDGWLLNFTNPLTKLCEAATRLSKTKTVGFCHGIFDGMEQLSKLLEIPEHDLEVKASGLNHITWFQSIKNKKTGEDLYPVLKEKESNAHWLGDWDEMALSRILFNRFGLFPSPGTNHIGEYLGWAQELLGSSSLQFFFDPAQEDPWKSKNIPTWIYNLHGNTTKVPLFAHDTPDLIFPDRHYEEKNEVTPSTELTIPFIEGILCGVERELEAIDIPNKGYIPGLPEDAIVEVPARVGPNGMEPLTMDRLPEPVLAILRTQCSINQLLVEAFDQNSKEKLLQAVLTDPTCRSYRNAVYLVDEMIEVQKEVLPELK